jgi:hypothetical protein
MHQGKLVFAQLMVYLPLSTFRRCVAEHRGEHKVKDFSCLDQFLAMAFAQLTYRESLRDIEINLRAQARRLYHMGFRCQTISRNTLANANATRPWQIYADFAQHMIGMARALYAQEPFGVELDATVYAFDASTIDLCLSVFAWAPFRSTKAAIKLHTLLDLWGNIPSFIHITDGKTHEVNVLDDLVLEPGAFYLMDRGYLDFSRLFVIHEATEPGHRSGHGDLRAGHVDVAEQATAVKSRLRRVAAKLVGCTHQPDGIDGDVSRLVRCEPGGMLHPVCRRISAA